MVDVDVDSLKDPSLIGKCIEQLEYELSLVNARLEDRLPGKLLLSNRRRDQQKLEEAEVIVDLERQIPINCLPNLVDFKSRSISMTRQVDSASRLANELAGKVRQLDTVKERVLTCVAQLDGVIRLQQCAAKAQQAFDSGNFHLAALLFHDEYASSISRDVVCLARQLTSAQDSVACLDRLRDQLIARSRTQFDQLANQHITASEEEVEQLFTILCLVGEKREAVDRFGHYLTSFVIASKCDLLANLSSNDDKTGSSVVDILTGIVECIAETVKESQGLVENYCGPGYMFQLVRLMQHQVGDSRLTQTIAQFRSRHRLDSLLASIRANTVESAVDQLGLESIITDAVLLTTRVNLYFRFMRRRVVSDLTNVIELKSTTKGEVNGEESSSGAPSPANIDEVDAYFNTCSTAHRMQDLISDYITLEEFFMREMVLKALSSDEVDDEIGQTFRYVDDVFFIVKKCLTRCLTSASVDGLCAMLNNTDSVLLDLLINRTLSDKIKAGFPAWSSTSAWMQDAYVLFNTAATAATLANPSTTSSSGPTSDHRSTVTTSSSSPGHSRSGSNVQPNLPLTNQQYRHRFLLTINSIELGLTLFSRLTDQLQSELGANLFDRIASSSSSSQTSRDKIQACLGSLKDNVKGRLEALLDQAFDQLSVSIVRPQVKSLLHPFSSLSYMLKEDDLEEFRTNDPWIQTCITNTGVFFEQFRVILSTANFDRLVVLTTGQLVTGLERLIQQRKLNRFGAIQLERDVRSLLAFLSKLTSLNLRGDCFQRLLLICTLLNLDSVNELTHYPPSATRCLTPSEIRQFLGLRSEFSTADIRQLKI